MNLGRLVKKAADLYGDKTAVIFQDKSLSFRQINERANRLANGLLSLGVKKGDCVAFLGLNSYQYVEADFASAKTGTIRVPLRSRLTPGELLHIMNNSEANTLILEERFINDVGTIRKDLPHVKRYIALSGGGEDMMSYEDLLADSSPDEPDIDVLDDDGYALIYTTGTTGNPKGATQTHRNLLWVIRSIQLDALGSHKITEDDVLLSFLPLMHAPIILILPHFINGAKHVIQPGFDAKAVLDTIERERVTAVFMVPTVIYMLLEYPELKKYDLSSIKTIIYGGSPMVPERLIDAIKVFGNVFVQAYGLAEAFMPITFLSKKQHADAIACGQLKVLSSAGKESTFEEIKIVDDDGREVGLNEPGEIILRGDNMMKGYWKNPGATNDAISNGWFHTGDIGMKDDGDYIYIVDRKHEMIITGGLNVYPKEVEDLIYTHPAVFEVVVIGVPDTKWGESIKAVVAFKQGMTATEAEIINFCKGRVADYKIPKSVDFVDALPKGGSEKILRKDIRDRYWKGQKRKVH